MDNCKRSDIKIGMRVGIILKKDQPTGKLTFGHVAKILTNSSYHHQGIKVMLDENNMVGRVKRFL